MILATDYPTLQEAVNAASERVGVVHIPPQGIDISQPLILPRGGLTGAGVVHLVGQGNRPEIRGAANFPKERALIEWADVAERAWNQRLENLTLKLPNVTGVKAAHYKLHDPSSWLTMHAERMQIVMRDIEVLCHNDYHEVLFDFEGGTQCSEFTNIQGNPGLGNNTYNTLLFRAGRDLWEGGKVASELPDVPGFFSCRLSRIYSTGYRGGRSRMFEGRLNACTWDTSFADGSTEPSMHLIQSAQSTLTGVLTEGRQEQPANWLLEDCASLSLVNCGIGHPYEYKPGAGFGNGMELRRCRDIRFDGRLTGPKSAIYSVQSQGQRVLVIDADCKRCTGANIQVRGTAVTDEIRIEGDASNQVEYILFQADGSVERGFIIGSDVLG